PMVIDVRRAPAVAKSGISIPTAVWRDIADFTLLDVTGGRTEARNRALVIHCIHGHNVSQLATSVLRASGFTARCLAGGIEHWVQAGAPVCIRDGSRPSGPLVMSLKPDAISVLDAWIVRRYLDRNIKICCVDALQVTAVADEIGGRRTASYGEAIDVGEFGIVDPVLAAFVSDMVAGVRSLSGLRAAIECLWLDRSMHERRAISGGFAMLDAMYHARRLRFHPMALDQMTTTSEEVHGA
ncbi:MAG: rhodanese-like domain-containing protein, partial [Pseudomonadota bacterium]